ncbi:hypothetical protein Taro_053943 [Colocasia esculenta]|uniref:Uncharacterized protein n=1 Tax=Colocasia esculenta TaxID=4460 RepID=A0A843XP17_COLES|nr:hypothetical protein [Colocasia esculenta]
MQGKFGRVEEFLAAGEAGDPHTKPFFFPVVSTATYINSHLEVDQRSLVSTLPDLVSTLPDQFFPKGDYDIQEEEQVEDGNASE